MSRGLAIIVAVFTTAIVGFAAEELPKDDGDEAFEVEPPLLIPNRPTEPTSVTAAATPAPIVDPARLERELARAKTSAANAGHLFKIGALAKVEVEQRALRVLRLQSDLENARLILAKEAMVQQQNQLAAGQISKADLSTTEIALAHAIQAAHSAAAKREQAEIDAAELNLHRQQKLFAAGSGRKSDVSRAEQKVAELKAQKN